MKVKRKDWEALKARIADLECSRKEFSRLTLTDVSTGQVLTSIVVQMILRHLRMKVVHGRCELVPESETVQPSCDTKQG